MADGSYIMRQNLGIAYLEVIGTPRPTTPLPGEMEGNIVVLGETVPFLNVGNEDQDIELMTQPFPLQTIDGRSGNYLLRLEQPGKLADAVKTLAGIRWEIAK